MSQFLKTIFCVSLFVLLGCKAIAQKFTTHAVKEGETLESVAKQYRVPPSTILKYNKEIKAGQKLAPNTILVIPADGTAAGTTPVQNTPATDVQETSARGELIGFRSHKVKKRETLYGISKRYGVTEEDIKRYNKQLYAGQLKKRMILSIPRFKKVAPGEGPVMNPEDYETYTVTPKETRWSIAHKNGITIDSLLILNPSLSKTTDYLREGQELKLPKKAGSTIKTQEAQLFTSYTVPPKMNFYQLEKQFGVKSDEVVRLNPEISERGGLKEGMVIRLPQKKLDAGDVNTDNYIFYEVKPKQNEFRLTRKFGMTWTDLLKFNPELSNGVKAGMVLKLPKNQVGNFEVRNSLVLDKIDLLDSINTGNVPRVLVLLPFRFDRLDMADVAGVKRDIELRTDIKASLQLYSGALVALDSIADLGISVDVKTFDNQLSLTKTKELLAGESLSSYNAVFGPLDVPSLKEVAIQASSSGNRIPVIAPTRIQSDLSLPNVFFSYTSEKLLREQMLTYMDTLVTDQNIIIVADKKNEATRKLISERFPDAKVAMLIEEEKNISLHIDRFIALLSKEKENWVFVETDNAKLVPSVSSILNSNNTKDVKVRMFTTNKNRAFDNEAIPISHLSNLNFTYPSVYREVGSNSFVKRYADKFGDTPDRFAVRGFDIMYDLLLKLAYKNDLFSISQIIGETEYNGTKFSYEKDPVSGFYNQSSYIISYEEMRVKEIRL